MLSSIQGLFGKKSDSVAQPVSQAAPVPNEKSNISVRTPDEVEDLERAIKVGPVTFIFVHADWCGHCQTYKPIWNDLESAPGRQANMAMIHHDMVANSPTLKDAKIPGYPTVLKVYPNGRIEDYDNKEGKTNGMPNIRDKDAMMKEIATALSAAKGQNAQKLNNSGIKAENIMKALNRVKSASNSSRKNGSKSYVTSVVARRNIGNNVAVHASDDLVEPEARAVSIGATQPPKLPVPPMTGGSLYATLTRALIQAGPASALLVASQSLPPKKNRGSTKRLTRKSAATRRNSKKSGSSKSRKN